MATARIGTDGSFGFSGQPETQVERLRSWPSDNLKLTGPSITGINSLYSKMFYSSGFANAGVYSSDDGGASLLLVISESTRILVQENSVDVSSHAGVDYKGNLGSSNPEVISRVKTNGAVSGATETLTFSDADSATLTVGINVKTFTRLRGGGSHSANFVECRVSKIASYLQNSPSDPNSAPISESSSPFSWEVSARSNNLIPLPIFRIDSSRGFQLQPDDDDPDTFSLLKRSDSRLNLDGSEGLPVPAYYTLHAAGVDSVISFEGGSDFPTVPKVVGTGTWTAGVFEPQAGVLKWTSHPNGSSRDARTLLTIQDPSTQQDALPQTVIPSAVNQVDLSRTLTPGKVYLCTIVHETDSRTSNTYFGSTHTSYRSVNSFSLRIASEPAVLPPDLTLPTSFTRTYGNEAFLFVRGNGSPDVSYEWFHNGLAIPGQTASCLYLMKSSPLFSGAFHVVVTGPSWRVRSNNAYLNPGPPKALELILGKDVRFRQTGPSEVDLDTAAAANGDHGAYGFSVLLSGKDYQKISPPSITPPGIRHSDFIGNLFFDEDELAWSYGQNGRNFRTNSLSDLNAIFPSGTYKTVHGSTVTNVALPSATYPNTPTATFSGGTWINGKYAVAKDSDLTIETNIFTGISNGSGGGILVQYGTEEIDLASADNPIPAKALMATRAFEKSSEVSIAFISFYDAKGGASTLSSASAYISSTITEVHVLPYITKQPQGATIQNRSSYSLEIEAGGTHSSGQNSLTYQWTRDGLDLFGENSPVMAIRHAKRTQSGSYCCIVSNDVGSVISTPVVLTVLPEPYETYLDSFATSPEDLGPDHFDADGDGTPNLLEFLFQTDSHKISAGNLPTTALEQNKLKFSYLRASVSSSIQQDVEYAETLEGPWQLALEGVDNVTKTIVNLGSGTQRVTYFIPTQSPMGFARLKATRR